MSNTNIKNSVFDVSVVCVYSSMCLLVDSGIRTAVPKAMGGSHWGCHTLRALENAKAVPVINSLSKHYIVWILPTSSFEVLKSMCYYAVRDTAMERNKIIKLGCGAQMLSDMTTRCNKTVQPIQNQYC